MKLAIQEHLLPGDNPQEQLDYARSLGVDGIELRAEGMDERIMPLAAALDATGIAVSALNVGGTHLLHPDFDTRDAAIAHIRQAMADSLDLEAELVIFAAQRADTPRLPDLRPFKHQLEMEADFLAIQLRATLGDLAYAMGARLALATTTRYETPLLHRLEQAASILARNDNNPHLKIAVNTFCMALEEDDLYAALKAHLKHIAVLHLADHNGRLPGQGWIDFGKVITLLREANFEGWLTIAGENQNLRTQDADLRAAVNHTKALIEG